MRIYNAVGYTIIVVYGAACLYCAPAHLGPWTGLSIGMAYLIVCWFFAGVYLSCVIHMGIAHRALDYKDWFVEEPHAVNNAFGVYINPVTWVNRHRLHHRFADHPGDPNKLSADGFWRTLYLCLFPYKTDINVANDAILTDLVVSSRGKSHLLRRCPGADLLASVVVAGRSALCGRALGDDAHCSRCGSTWSKTTGHMTAGSVTAGTTTSTTTR